MTRILTDDTNPFLLQLEGAGAPGFIAAGRFDVGTLILDRDEDE